MKDIILACDIGTSSIKASMFQVDGERFNPVLSASVPCKSYNPMPGRTEQDPEDWWNGIVKITRELAGKNPEAAKNVAAIGVSGHMLGCTPVDCSGRALYRGMIHSDSRAANQFERVCSTVGADRMYRLTGNILDARSTLCKILWLKDEEPEVYGKTAKFLQSKDFIAARMTGNIDTTDYSDACHAELMDISKRAYDASIFKELGIDPSRLPELHRSVDVIGKLTEERAAQLGLTAGIPVIAGGGDGACSAAGAGNTRPGDIFCCLGTTSWIAECSTTPFIDEKKRIFNIMDLGGDTCSVLGTMQAAGGSLTWLMELLSENSAGHLDELAATVHAGCDGLIYLPYLDGERSPIFDIAARGMFFGLSQMHKRQHLMRATLEGVAYALRSILDVMRERHDIAKMRIIGGGSNSSIWRQIIADVCDIAIYRLSVPPEDATSLGIAAAAGVGVGLFKSVAAGVSFVTETDLTSSIEPEMYTRNYEVFSALYPATKELMHKLAR